MESAAIEPMAITPARVRAAEAFDTGAFDICIARSWMSVVKRDRHSRCPLD
jgi:hypothetical protein